MELNERISALIDDAGDPADHEALLQSLHNAELRGTWSRYHLIGDTLRNQDLIAPDSRLLDNVAAAIATAPTHTHTVIPFVANPARRWRRRPALSAALAASAVLAVLGIIAFSSVSTNPPAVAAAEQDRSLDLKTRPEIPVLSDGEYQRRLNAYLVNFNEQRAQLHVPGVHPYVRVVDFDSSTP